MDKKSIIVISSISIFLLLVVLLVLVFLNKDFSNTNTSNNISNTTSDNSTEIIPNDYKIMFTDDKSSVDGPKKVYYVYNDKIIEEKTSYYPVGHPSGTSSYKVTEYNNVKTKKIEDLSDVYDAIRNKKGNIISEQNN